MALHEAVYGLIRIVLYVGVAVLDVGVAVLDMGVAVLDAGVVCIVYTSPLVIASGIAGEGLLGGTGL